MSKPKLRIGIFGGVFDPPHNGHLEIIKAVQKEMNFDVFLVSVCHSPCHKHPPLASYEDRMIMTRYMAKNVTEGYFGFREVVVGGEENLPRPNYTFNLIQNMHSKFSELVKKGNIELELFLVMGSDEWENFPFWHRVDELYNMCEEIVVVQRANYEVAEFENFSCKIIERKGEGISSTKIRERIKNGEDISDLVPALVEMYIRQNNLYKGDENVNRNYWAS
jgi:nicotinate-nucleotide adenylyltransferase